jgi:hypothetical protein
MSVLQDAEMILQFKFMKKKFFFLYNVWGEKLVFQSLFVVVVETGSHYVAQVDLKLVILGIAYATTLWFGSLQNV